MTCGGCAKAVCAAVLNLDAQAGFEADPASRTVEIRTSVTSDAVQAALADAGFPGTIAKMQ